MTDKDGADLHQQLGEQIIGTLYDQPPEIVLIVMSTVLASFIAAASPNEEAATEVADKVAAAVKQMALEGLRASLAGEIPRRVRTGLTP